ncbi:MAG: hypothetical protein AAGA36_00345 [Pseudomonadota bacterium]
MGGIDSFVTDAARTALRRNKKAIYKWWERSRAWYAGFGTPHGWLVLGGRACSFDDCGCPVVDGRSWRYLEDHHKEQVAQMWLHWREAT